MYSDIHLDHRVLIAEEELRERAGQLRLADAWRGRGR